MRLTLIALISALAVACASPDREVQLRETIQDMARALEQHEVEPFLEHVADDFTGDGGSWDIRRVKRFVLGQALRKERVSISLDEINVTLHVDRASAEVIAGITGDSRWWPERGTDYRFQTGWRLEDDEWRVIRADWRPVN